MRMIGVPPTRTHSSIPLNERWEYVCSILGRYALLVLGSMLFLIPFFVMVRSALMTQRQIVSLTWTWFPNPISFSSFTRLFNDADVPMMTGLLNSLLIAVLTVVGQLLICSLAGYGLARIPYKWSNIVFYFVLGTMLVPSAVTFIPGFVVVSALGWVNTLQGLIVPTLFSGFATFWFRQYFLDFPTELEDAARVDGLNNGGIFWRIALPNSRNVLLSQAAIIFIWSWNAFLWPLVIGQDQSSWTVQVVLSSFVTSQTIDLPEIFAGATVSIIPLLLLFLCLQRYIVQGVVRTGISK